MEHVTEALYLSAAAVVFALAVSVMLYVGSCTDELFETTITQGMSSSLFYEEQSDE